MHDVIVVGAGPTGCYAARELARRGYEVLVLEEHHQIGEPVHCAGILGLGVFDRFGLACDVIESYLSSARMVSPSGQSFRVSSDTPQAVLVDRSRFDQRLAEQALSLGASFLLDARVTRVETAPNRIQVTATCSGEQQHFTGSLLVLATGASHTLSQSLGLAQHTGPTMYGAQLIAETGELPEVEVHLGRSIAPGGFAWAIPGNGHGSRIGLVCRGRPQGLLQEFTQKLERRGAIGRQQSRIRCRPVPTGGRTPSYTDRVLVIGDAAGQVKSTTSGGVYYGLIGAEAAVNAADESLQRGDLSSAKLSVYERAWRSRIGVEQAAGRLCRRIQEGLRDRELELLFWAAQRTGLPRVLSSLRFDWHATGLLSILSRETSLSPSSR